MSHSKDFRSALSRLKDVLLTVERNRELEVIVKGREEVQSKYGRLFSIENLPKLTAEEFQDFLLIRNNYHWNGIHRHGSKICKDMDRLRKALGILLDDDRPVRDRLNDLIPLGGKAFVPFLGKAIITPILLVTQPSKYSVWNSVSEGAMRSLNVWPQIENSTPFGEKYERINDIQCSFAGELGVDLWTLDALWWGVVKLKPDTDGPEDEVDSTQELEPELGAQRFWLERHLHEFMRDNWNLISLGKEWMIFDEDGDPEAGYEYQCDVGRIDLLARARRNSDWLVIELKRNHSSDSAVGQVLRYMGWVKKHLAKAGETVQGMVIAHKADEAIRYALAATNDIELVTYEIDFHLRKLDIDEIRESSS
jgi:hypothetical protein